MKINLEELTRSEATGGGDLEMYLTSGQVIKLNQAPLKKGRTSLSKKAIKNIIAKEEKKRKKKIKRFFKIEK